MYDGAGNEMLGVIDYKNAWDTLLSRKRASCTDPLLLIKLKDAVIH